MAKNTTCAVCGADRAPGSSWCPEHRDQFRAVGRPAVDAPAAPPYVPDYLPLTPPETPPGARLVTAAEAAPAVRAEVANQWPASGHRKKTVCAEPGCDEPRWSTDNQQYARCEAHQRAKWNKTATNKRRAADAPVETVADVAALVEAVPLPYDEPVPVMSALVPSGPSETAVSPAAQVPDLLQQMIRQALQSADPALTVTVTGVKVSFAAELDIAL